MGPEEAFLTSSLCFQGRTVTPALPGENAALAGDGDSRAGLLGVESRCSLRGIRAGNVKPALPKAFLTTEPGPLLASDAFSRSEPQEARPPLEGVSVWTSSRPGRCDPSRARSAH